MDCSPLVTDTKTAAQTLKSQIASLQHSSRQKDQLAYAIFTQPDEYGESHSLHSLINEAKLLSQNRYITPAHKKDLKGLGSDGAISATVILAKGN